MPYLVSARAAGRVTRRLVWVVPAVLALLAAGCAQQRIRADSQAHMASGEFEEAVSVLQAGVQEHPESALLRSGLVQARSDALTRLLSQVAAARAAGRLEDAEKTLRRAQTFDSAGRAAALLEEIATERRQRKALAVAQALLAERNLPAAQRVVEDALKDSPRLPELLALQRRLAALTRERQVQAAQAGLAEARPISLDFRDAGLRAVLDAVSRHSGLNFILDKDIRPDIRITVFLRAARVEDALDLVVGTHQLAKKVLDERTVLIYPNTPEKQREHQEQLVKVFYLASSDAKGAAAFLRAMLKLREPHVDERLNLLALRDSAENVALAERLIAIYDGQESEVLLEVEVLEIRTSRLTDLGIKFPSAVSLALTPPSGAAALTLASVRRLTRDDIELGIGATTITLRREVGDFNTLANPRIRARSREKAKVLIGDKVPVVTTTTGQSGFVSESVNYLDVGLKLDVEPTVYPDSEVAIRVALEVSSIAREIRTASGSLAYQIGTRNASTMLRLRDGETQLLAGLISREDRNSRSGVPGLGDLPILGRLFSAESDDSQRTELVLAITPRIVRNVRLPDAAESEVWIGTESQPRLRPVAGRVDQVTTQPPGQPPAQGQPTGAAVPAPQTPVQPTGMLNPQSPSPVSMRLQGPTRVQPGDTFVVSVQVDAAAPLRGGALRLSFPRDRFAVLGVLEGDLLGSSGTGVNFTHTVDAARGTIEAALLRSAATGATGSGTYLQIRFRALTPGDAELAVSSFEPVVLGTVALSPAVSPLRLVVAP